MGTHFLRHRDTNLVIRDLLLPKQVPTKTVDVSAQKQRTSAESEVPQNSAITKSQTPKTPPSVAASQETPSPLSPAGQLTPASSDSSPIDQSKPTDLESDSQNSQSDPNLSKAKATYRVSGVMAGDFLNMRQGPRISYSVIQRLQNGVEG